MNNPIANQAISDCNDELIKIRNQINQLGSTNSVSGFLTRYSLIKICGTLEICYKTIIADFYEQLAPHLGSFIGYHLRDASMNAKYENICNAIVRFDKTKSDSFKARVQALHNKDKALQSLSDLNTARNEFAHGNIPNLSFNDLCDKFIESIRILEELDSIMT